MKKTIIISAIALLLVVGTVSAITVIGTPQEIKELLKGEQQIVEITELDEVILGGRAGHIVNVVGSRTGSSTTPVYFSTLGATTTYPILFGREYDSAIFTIQATEASTTPLVYFSVLASNEYNCDTATTTTTMVNQILASEVQWFDISSHINNLAGSTTLNSGTSTVKWIPALAGQGTILALEDLNYRCLALDVNASGTAMWIQANKKTYR